MQQNISAKLQPLRQDGCTFERKIVQFIPASSILVFTKLNLAANLITASKLLKTLKSSIADICTLELRAEVLQNIKRIYDNG